MDESDIKERISKGAFRIKTIIQIAGWPKEHVELTVNKTSESIKNREKTIILSSEINEAKLVSKKTWLAFIEAEILIAGFADVIGFVLDYLPTSIEIIDPAEFKENNHNLASILNDFVERIYALNHEIRRLKITNSILTESLTPEKRQELEKQFKDIKQREK